MKISELAEEWRQDAKVDLIHFREEIEKTMRIHAKYIEYHSKEKRILTRLQHAHNKLYKLKREYYKGTLDVEEVTKLGWDMSELNKTKPKRILKEDLDTWVEADNDYINSLLKIEDQTNKVEFLESILKAIDSRSYHFSSYSRHVAWEDGR